MIHVIVVAVWCAACVLLGLSWPALFWPAAFYLGKEHAQAEERFMRARDINREKAPWWMGIAPSAWTLKSLLDCLLPLAVSIASAMALHLL